MSIVRKCDTCSVEYELDKEDLDITLPDGWTVDDLDRETCDECNGLSAQLEAEVPSEEEAVAFTKNLKKETRKLNKINKLNKEKREVTDVE